MARVRTARPSRRSRFYWRQERGRFRFDDIYSEAATALADGKSVKHAIECIRGALKDFARDGDKLVHDVERTPEEWQRTHGEPERPIQGPWRVYFENGVRVLVCPTGPYRSNAQLLAGSGRVTSRHGKVPCAIGRTLYDDTWNQEFSQQVSAGSSDKQSDQEAELSKRDKVPQRGELGGGKRPTKSPDYKGGGRKQRWSKSCLSSGGGAGIAGVALKSVPDFWPRTINGHVAIGPLLHVPRQPAVSRDRKVAKLKFKRSRPEPGRWTGAVMVREDLLYGVRGAPAPDAVTSVRFGLAPQNGPAGPVEARAIAKLLAEILPEAPAEDAEMSPAEKAEAAALALSMETPKVSLPKHWLSTMPVDMDKTPWACPTSASSAVATCPTSAKRRTLGGAAKIFSPAVLKFSVWADTICERGVPKPSRSRPGGGQWFPRRPGCLSFAVNVEAEAHPARGDSRPAPAACQVATRSCRRHNPFFTMLRNRPLPERTRHFNASPEEGA